MPFKPSFRLRALFAVLLIGCGALFYLEWRTTDSQKNFNLSRSFAEIAFHKSYRERDLDPPIFFFSENGQTNPSSAPDCITADGNMIARPEAQACRIPLSAASPIRSSCSPWSRDICVAVGMSLQLFEQPEMRRAIARYAQDPCAAVSDFDELIRDNASAQRVTYHASVAARILDAELMCRTRASTTLQRSSDLLRRLRPLIVVRDDLTGATFQVELVLGKPNRN